MYYNLQGWPLLSIHGEGDLQNPAAISKGPLDFTIVQNHQWIFYNIKAIFNSVQQRQWDWRIVLGLESFFQSPWPALFWFCSEDDHTWNCILYRISENGKWGSDKRKNICCCPTCLTTLNNLNNRQCFPPSKWCLADTKDPKPGVLLDSRSTEIELR